MNYKCPSCGKIWPNTMDLARHVFGTGDQAHKDWVNSKLRRLGQSEYMEET